MIAPFHEINFESSSKRDLTSWNRLQNHVHTLRTNGNGYENQGKTGNQGVLLENLFDTQFVFKTTTCRIRWL